MKDYINNVHYRRERYLTRWGQLEKERATWKAQWQDLSTFILPWEARLFPQDRNKGTSRTASIYDNTATRSLRILGSGLMAGATSPARRWFKLRTSDKELNNFRSVKIWLNDVTELIEAIFHKSNTYRSLHTMYEALGCFGTSVSIVLPNFTNVIHHYPLPVGEFCLATNSEGEVDTMYREFDMTAAQLVKQFGYENCSLAVQGCFDRGDGLETWHTVLHLIEPRADRDFSNPNAKNMPWASVYFERGGDSEKFLRESGFEYFPVLAPRWAVSGKDIYGNSPGMEALGDIRQLQHEQLRKAQCIDKQTNPPIQVPSSMKNREVDTLPGGVTYYDPSNANNKIQSIYDVRLNLADILNDIMDCRERIKGSFYADLFLMLYNIDNNRMTATEVAERHEEKLLMLGPVLERMHNELLAPLVEMTFIRAKMAGILPPPPEEMKDVEISVEFVSMLAQAQRAVGANAIDRWVGNVGAMSQIQPDVMDNVDTDKWCETYADMLGVDPNLVVPKERVDAIRQARADKQAQQEQAALMEQQSKTAANMAKAMPDSTNANVMDSLTGYGTPGVVSD